MIKGSEILLFSSLAVVTIVFGSFGIYFVESPNPEASIDNLHDAFWWSIETITTVAYGEYYPITSMTVRSRGAGWYTEGRRGQAG